MRCEKCGALITSIKTSRFAFDGSDFDTVLEIEEDNRFDSVIMETDRDWTGYELTESEMRERLLCPYCKQFPFDNDEIQIYEVVRIVCFKRDQTEKGGGNNEHTDQADDGRSNQAFPVIV